MRVNTPDGLKPIESLQIGDAVYSQDENGNRTVGFVSRTLGTTSCNYLIINDNIRVTETHPFSSSGTWRNAGDLAIGNYLANGVRINSVQRVEKGVRVYNIEVEPHHMFFVDNMLVHNKPGDGIQ